jgi:hypothetical protein
MRSQQQQQQQQQQTVVATWLVSFMSQSLCCDVAASIATKCAKRCDVAPGQ